MIQQQQQQSSERDPGRDPSRWGWSTPSVVTGVAGTLALGYVSWLVTHAATGGRVPALPVRLNSVILTGIAAAAILWSVARLRETLVARLARVEAVIERLEAEMVRVEATMGLGGNGVPASTRAAVRRLEGRHGG